MDCSCERGVPFASNRYRCRYRHRYRVRFRCVRKRTDDRVGEVCGEGERAVRGQRASGG